MATRPGTVEMILEQAAGAGAVSARRMFGEYGLYCGDKLVALVCDDRLFVKPTEAGRAYLGAAAEAPPYPGAKPCFLIPGEAWEDADWLAGLIRTTAAALPPPAPRKGPKEGAEGEGRMVDVGPLSRTRRGSARRAYRRRSRIDT